ncbi:MAG TPA: hypothetical protein VF142_22770 [Longimicrobium sp.]
MSSDAPRIPTPVIDYHHLRLMAEWASSLRDREVEFAVRDGALWLEGADGAGGRPALRVPAATPGRYGAVGALTVSVRGAEEPLDLAPYGVDALVWSEAAVEKFLVPYYASCAGARAGQFLTALFDAWNGDHGAARPVALAHLAHTAGQAPLTLADTLGVVFVDEEGDVPATLELLPLAVFRARYPGRWEPSAGVDAGMVELGARVLPDDAHLPTYPELRGLAEWAGSLRGRTAYLAYDPRPASARAHREGRAARIPGPGPSPTERIVFPVHTPLAVPGRPRPESVRLVPADGGASVELVRDVHCDAVFTSTGAMEQFLFPYYASVRGALGMHELRQMAAAWAGAEPSAGHARTETAAPLGLVHLPHSDWTTETEEEVAMTAGSPLDEVGVVAPAADGGRRILTVRQAAGG